MEPTVSFPEKWTAPRELSRALPRETRITGRGIGVRILAVVVLAASAPAFFFVHNQDVDQAARNETLRTQGQQATGEINRLWHEGRAGTPMVGYAFGANGAWIHGEAEVPQKLWPGIRKAGSLPIRYLPSNPTVNHPMAWEKPAPAPWLAVAFPLLLAGSGTFLFFNLRRQAALLAEGTPAPGVVMRCFRIKGGYRVSYQFRAGDGTVTKGSDKVMRRMDNGTQVCVLYLAQNPRRSQVYPLSLYRVA